MNSSYHFPFLSSDRSRRYFSKLETLVGGSAQHYIIYHNPSLAKKHVNNIYSEMISKFLENNNSTVFRIDAVNAAFSDLIMVIYPRVAGPQGVVVVVVMKSTGHL